MNISEHLSCTAAIVPDAVAIRFEGADTTYAKLNQLSMSASQHLLDAGIKPGDRVALMLANVPAFAVWYFAAVRIGAIAVSVSTRAAAAEVSFLMADCEASLFVSDVQTLQKVKSELPKCVQATAEANDAGTLCNGQEWTSVQDVPTVDSDVDDPAVILYTSGTTGFAKGATLSHGNLRSNVHAVNHLCNMQSTDRILLAVPLFHCFGQNALLNSALQAGATLVLQRRFDLNESKRLIADEKVTQLYGVPMMFQLFLESCSAADLQSVTFCFSAAATMPLQVANQWADKFKMPIHEGYGLTETSPFASYNHRLKFVPGSIGTPIDNCEMKIVDTETGEDCPPGKLGEIVVRGPNVMLGYWNRQEDTDLAIRDGWFHSGDIGKMDEQAFFYIVDRVKDMIAVGGLKVFPAEVERVLLDHSAIREVAVVGIADDVFGEQVVAYLVLNADSANADSASSVLESIRQYAKQKLANYKVPRIIVPITELPRNPSGKVLKRELRDRDIAGQVAATASDQADGADVVTTSQLRPATLDKQLQKTHQAGRGRVAVEFVQHLVQVIADRESIPEADSGFLDAGMDSLMIVEMSNQIQVELGDAHEVPATLVFDHPRICDLGEFLLATLSPEAVSPDAGSRGTGSSENSAQPSDSNSNQTPAVNLQQEVDQMSDAEALIALMKELEDS
ncbi:MAG: AMP-binding protein [Fuerstiella sp.]